MPTSNKRLDTKARKKAQLLNINCLAIENGSLTGAFYYAPWNIAEYTLHEAAHLLTLGRKLDDLPPDPTGWISDTFNSLPPLISDPLEMATAYLTHMAGQKLKLWGPEGEDKIIDSAVMNLSVHCGTRPERTEKLRQVFNSPKDPDPNSRQLEILCGELVAWWRAR